MDQVANPHLKALLEAMFGDEDVALRYRRAPAAKQIHHAFLGRAPRNTCSPCAAWRAWLRNNYPAVDADLLLTGVLLHDIGKIYELNYERGFSYSNDGQLLGHISIALRMISDKVREIPDFPPRLRSLVEHMILSHHGRLEFGSPKLPVFPEALLLHFLDDLDSKMECMRALIEKRPPDGKAASPRSGPALERTALEEGSLPERRRGAATARARRGRSRNGETADAPPALAAHPLFAPRPESPVRG